MKSEVEIVEKKIGIAPDYQYRAMRNALWAKRNWHKNKFDIIRMLSPFTKKENILDLGTGSGNFELLFARSVKQIHGVDYNDEALTFLRGELKKRKINNVYLTCADMRDLPKSLDKEKFDLILSVDTLEHISSSDGSKLIEWTKKRLTKNGKIIIITPNYRSFWTWLEPVLDILSFTPNMGTHQHLSNYSVQSLSKKLKNKGYKIERAITFNLFSFIFPTFLNQQLLRLETVVLGNAGCLMAIVAGK